MEPKGDTERKQAVRKPLPFEVCFTDRELYTGICKYLRSGDLSDNLLINACIYTICWIKSVYHQDLWYCLKICSNFLNNVRFNNNSTVNVSVELNRSLNWNRGI